MEDIPLRYAWLLLVALICVPGCAYRIGGGLTAGILEEIGGDGRSEGVETMGDQVLERALLVELGHQLGSGLSSGATDITPEQQAQMESVIDGLLTVAAERSGQGLHNEVSPQLRDMVQRGIIDTLTDGINGKLGDSLERTVDRVVDQAVVSLRQGMSNDETKYAMSDLIRESVYYAMREGQGTTPAVSETIEFTLTENLLEPMEESVGGITDKVAVQVQEQYQRTENLLKTIIFALMIVMSMLAAAYLLRGRRLQRVQVGAQAAKAALGSIDVALEGLDDATRAAVQAKLATYQDVARRAAEESNHLDTPDPAQRRDDDYMR